MGSEIWAICRIPDQGLLQENFTRYFNYARRISMAFHEDLEGRLLSRSAHSRLPVALEEVPKALKQQVFEVCILGLVSMLLCAYCTLYLGTVPPSRQLAPDSKILATLPCFHRCPNHGPHFPRLLVFKDVYQLSPSSASLRIATA